MKKTPEEINSLILEPISTMGQYARMPTELVGVFMESATGKNPFPERPALTGSLLGVIKDNPESLNAETVTKLSQLAAGDSNMRVQQNAFYALASVAEKRPELIDAATVKSIVQYQHNEHLPYLAQKFLEFNRGDLSEENAFISVANASMTALKATLKARPDLEDIAHTEMLKNLDSGTPGDRKIGLIGLTLLADMQSETAHSAQPYTDAVKAAKNALASDPDESVRMQSVPLLTQAAQAEQKMNPGDGRYFQAEVKGAFQSAVQNDKNSGIRYNALRNLENLGIADPDFPYTTRTTPSTGLKP